jgi:putative DNA primase/helicase
MEVYQTKSSNKPKVFQQLVGQSKNLNQIPDELKALNQWMGTKLRPHKNDPTKIDKPPYCVVGGVVSDVPVDKTNPENWTTFEEASTALERGGVDAIGIVLTEDDHLYGIDGDHCINQETGEIAGRVADFIHDHGTYTEVSISGEGVRLIGIGEKPSWARTVSWDAGFKLEVYDHAAFLVMTGNRISQHTEPQQRQRELGALCRELWPKPKTKRGPTRTTPIDLDDEALLDKARNSRKGARFKRLYDQGDTSELKSTSEADWSLTNSLIFWAGADPVRVERLFEDSALYRTREDGKDPGYVARNVRKALATYDTI